MPKSIKNIVILGGGSAGWLTAGLLAAEHCADQEDGVSVTLVESPDVPIIGVGEGTWPTMRTTLHKIGISETELFTECEASFKQGAKFARWVSGAKDDFYYHPLVLPKGYAETDLVFHWQQIKHKVSFADAFCFQGRLCEKGLAPKQITTPEYAAVANYAYHVNSTKLGQLLQKHCTEKLGVRHILDHVVSIESHENQDIAALSTRQNGSVKGDLFIDCSGMKSMLLGQHYGIPFQDKKSVLFNDTALAVQVPYASPDSPIVSHTVSTAQSAGWIWDIGLPTRRGVGYVFSSAHISDDMAEKELRNYIRESAGSDVSEKIDLRKITIQPGHREKFWHRNCVAVGMAAGFLEPLEASALVLVELSASTISEELPANRQVMDIVAKRFNDKFQYSWDSIIDFLKLHYILTRREDTEYWRDNVDPSTIPERLQELMSLWRYHPPNRHDFPRAEEVFPSASWQYVLYGMGFETEKRETLKDTHSDSEMSRAYMAETSNFANRCLAQLPTNRELINKIHRYGFQKV